MSPVILLWGSTHWNSSIRTNELCDVHDRDVDAEGSDGVCDTRTGHRSNKEQKTCRPVICRLSQFRIVKFVWLTKIKKGNTNLLKSRDRVKKFDIQSRVVLGQRDAPVEVDQFHNSVELVWLGEAIFSVAVRDLDQLIGASLAQSEGVLSVLAHCVPYKERTIGCIHQLFIDFISVKCNLL